MRGHTSAWKAFGVELDSCTKAFAAENASWKAFEAWKAFAADSRAGHGCGAPLCRPDAPGLNFYIPLCAPDFQLDEEEIAVYYEALKDIDDTKQRTYAAMVSFLDDAVGELVALSLVPSFLFHVPPYDHLSDTPPRSWRPLRPAVRSPCPHQPPRSSERAPTSLAM